MSKRERLLLWSVILVVGLFVSDRLVISPLQAKLGRLKTDADAVAQQIDEANVLIDNADLLKSRWASRQASGLKDDPAAARLNVQGKLSRAASQTGMTLNNLSAGGNLASGPFTEVRFSLTASGEMRSVVHFLEAVQEMSVPLAVLSCDVTRRSDNNQLTLRLTLSTLIENDKEAG